MRDLRFKLKPDIRIISTLSRMVRRFFHHHKLENAYKFDLALEELVANIIRYGRSEGSQDLDIYLEIKLHSDVIEAHLVDNGIPFNPLERELPDLTSAVEKRPVGGLGVYLAKVNLDDLHYERKNNQNHLFAKLIISDESL